MATLSSDSFACFFCNAWFSSCNFVIRAVCFVVLHLVACYCLPSRQQDLLGLFFCTLRRWSCWTVLSFSCSMLPVCVILNCVNSASKFPTVFRKVFNLLGVRERGSICSDISSVYGQYKMQTADCRLQTADRVQNAD